MAPGGPRRQRICPIAVIGPGDRCRPLALRQRRRGAIVPPPMSLAHRARGGRMAGGTAREAMAITLDHMIVPARDKDESARFYARIFGVPYEGEAGHFAPVKINPTLTLDFDTWEAAFEPLHYAFHVDDAAFDAIFARVREAGLAYGSHPWEAENGRLNDWNGGRGVYFRDPSRHLLELLTRP
jgi:catechol 2,3-dioxygenase-like lactoylglutathione lyase family enzyme